MSLPIIDGSMNLWIVDTMVSMTLLMAVVLLIRKPVAHFFGANISYLLWALPLARLFMPTLTLEAPAAVEAAEPAGASIIASSFAAMTSTEQVAASASAIASIDWVLIAIIIWIGGAGILFISKLASYFQFREDIVSDGQLVGRHGNIKILETAAVGGPLAFGLFQRYIAVPTDFFRNYAPRERELALDHEIAHHESGDLAANFIGLLVLSLHWFNPIAWLAWIAFRQDQETACDARILKQSGRKVRAVYGRTIAKSVSGHRLGLASPLGQKNKIKDRLKMLGQSEKSKLRKRLGALMVGAATVVALPLTATVTYAVEVEPVGNIMPVAPSMPPAPPEAQAATPTSKYVSISNNKDTTNIVVLDGKGNYDGSRGYKRTIKRGGKTIILHTNRELSEDEIREMVEGAEESRREADEAAREHRLNRNEMREAQREMKEAQRERERERRDAEREFQREMKEARREVEREVRRATRKARNIRHQTSSVWSIANQVSEISFAPRAPRAPQPPRALMPTKATLFAIRNVNCKTISKDLPFHSGHGVLIERAWAAVVDCSGYEPKKNRKKLLKMSLQVLLKSRSAAASCKKPDTGHAKKMQSFDRAIQHLQKKIATA